MSTEQPVNTSDHVHVFICLLSSYVSLHDFIFHSIGLLSRVSIGSVYSTTF